MQDERAFQAIVRWHLHILLATNVRQSSQQVRAVELVHYQGYCLEAHILMVRHGLQDVAVMQVNGDGFEQSPHE